MMPVLFSIGSFHVYSLSVALILSWLACSFLFWRALRDSGVEEERIFDLTFSSTIGAFLFSRAGYVMANLDLFRENPLRIAAIWVAPGLSLYGALIGALLVLVSLSRRHKVRVGQVLDAVAWALGVAMLIGTLGAWLDGSYVGTKVSLPWAVRFVGHLGTRHPVQAYEMIALSSILIILSFLVRRAKEKKWPYGLLGLWFFAMMSVSQFALEFFKDTHVYLSSLRANQWVLVALFAETMGAFYVRGGGREKIRPLANKIIGGIHGKFSKRSA